MPNPLKTEAFYLFGPYRLDRRARVLLRDGAIVPLTPKVLDMSKDELLQAVWPDSFVAESNLSQNISVLRKALGQAADERPYIETVPKRGYRFVAEVKTQPEIPDLSENGLAVAPVEPLPPAALALKPSPSGHELPRRL